MIRATDNYENGQDCADTIRASIIMYILSILIISSTFNNISYITRHINRWMDGDTYIEKEL